MKAKKILHIAGCDKFIPPYVDFVNDNFNSEMHEFLISSGMASDELNDSSNIYLSESTTFSRVKYYFQLIIKMHQADKVILHSLFNIRLVQILFFTPWLLKKCYWVIWGGDLYVHKFGKRNNEWKVKEFFRRPVIKNMGHLVTYIEGDITLARKWYGAKGNYHECLMYTSNLYREYEVPENKETTVNIQVGNSADPSNNHIEVLEKLLPFKDENICIFVPLSYGSEEYAQSISKKGKEWFGDKFNPITAFMPFEQYLSFLGSIDIAIFNHKRQQAMGNTITLLGLGKTVYIRSDTTQWQFFKDKGIDIGDVDELSNLNQLPTKNNIEIVKSYFSEANYFEQLNELFN